MLSLDSFSLIVISNMKDDSWFVDCLGVITIANDFIHKHSVFRRLSTITFFSSLHQLQDFLIHQVGTVLFSTGNPTFTPPPPKKEQQLTTL